MLSFTKKLFSDFLFLVPVIAVGLILIGSYLRYEYLEVGYLDWFMHAFRIKSLEQYGLTSWTHNWSSGMNFWATYQFVSHYVVLTISEILNLSITRSMILASVGSFILTRVFIFSVLRSIGVNRVYALFGTILTFLGAQEWITIKDFSIYIPIILVPLMVLLWVKAFNNSRLLYIMAAVFGTLWMLHPILGLTFAGLFIVMILFRFNILGWKRSLMALILYSLGGFPFLAERMTLHAFSNPYLSATQFLRQMVGTPNMGLGEILPIIMIVTTILWITKISKLSQWLTVFWIYVLGSLAFIYLNLQGVLPNFINVLQAPRAVTLIALFIPMAFVMTLQSYITKQNKVTLTVMAIVSAVVLTQAISIASRYTAIPTNQRINAVASYFGDSTPNGRVYFDNLTEANYLSNSNIRYVNSYAEHMEPHPLSMRFKALIEQTTTMPQIPQSHLENIKNYSQVLGVEYLFIPKASPLITTLVNETDGMFEIVEQDVADSHGIYTVVRTNFPIVNAFVYDANNSSVSFEDIEQPKIDSRSYENWDKEVAKIAELIKSENVTYADVDFTSPESLEIQTRSINSGNDHLMILTSYSPNWSAEKHQISPTSLRFMDIALPNSQNSVSFKHSWPEWKTPAYAVSLSSIAVGGLLFVTTKKRS